MAVNTIPVLKLNGIAKRFGDLKVLQDLNLSIQQGEVFGLLGRNGAGKSTAIQIMVGMLQPDHGRVDAFGEPLSKNITSARKRIGYVSQQQHFYPWMTPRMLGRFVRHFYPNWDGQRYDDLLDNAEIPQKRKIGGFSGGMQAKLALSLALAVDPELLILDEPTAGMDPVARKEFLNIVTSQEAARPRTTLFSSHLMDDVEAVADRIGILNGGVLSYEGALAPLANSLGTYSIELGSRHADSTPGDFAKGAVRILADERRLNRRVVAMQFDPEAPSNPSLNVGWRVEAMTLEDIFLALVAGQRPTS